MWDTGLSIPGSALVAGSHHDIGCLLRDAGDLEQAVDPGQIGAILGLDVGRARWGGSSDANLTAAAGVPTVDGFGPIGGDAHQTTEHIEVESLPVRMALFAETVASFVDEAAEPEP